MQFSSRTFCNETMLALLIEYNRGFFYLFHVILLLSNLSLFFLCVEPVEGIDLHYGLFAGGVLMLSWCFYASGLASQWSRYLLTGLKFLDPRWIHWAYQICFGSLPSCLWDIEPECGQFVLECRSSSGRALLSSWPLSISAIPEKEKWHLIRHFRVYTSFFFQEHLY